MENEQKLGKDVTTQTTKKRKKNKNNIYIYKEWKKIILKSTFRYSRHEIRSNNYTPLYDVTCHLLNQGNQYNSHFN